MVSVKNCYFLPHCQGNCSFSLYHLSFRGKLWGQDKFFFGGGGECPFTPFGHHCQSIFHFYFHYRMWWPSVWMPGLVTHYKVTYKSWNMCWVLEIECLLDSLTELSWWNLKGRYDGTHHITYSDLVWYTSHHILRFGLDGDVLWWPSVWMLGLVTHYKATYKSWNTCWVLEIECLLDSLTELSWWNLKGRYDGTHHITYSDLVWYTSHHILRFGLDGGVLPKLWNQ